MKQLIIELTKEEQMLTFGGKVVYKIVIINGQKILIAEIVPN